MYGSKTTAVKPQRAQSSRDELINNRYNLSEPEGVYPLDGSHSGINKYPDFQPWKHTVKEDHIAVDHLQRGYFESPQVGNELLSARNIMHQLLRSKNSLESLSSNVLMAMDLRARNNRVGPGTYKPPPRVTLTDQKRENWLKDLANSEVPLRKLARTIPHGVRNKTLIEQCVSKKIPITRAIWFVRCVSTNELRGLKRKVEPISNTHGCKNGPPRCWNLLKVVSRLPQIRVVSTGKGKLEDECKLSAKICIKLVH
ncbi:unnamed protein product [Cyberlindnera jadinii]|uniref:Mediator of RNA polymerase II transcription subunit 12 n=1 Tax=Cyberlindnera jadinii (strain ATCC 18201 / CBS 1600 / BCRC 20928 / JCM 3617 / NBRC 0987 / NRRL Y-1542) TaxID=983966 RepID=A0A0H5C9N9_CYBJN|nr:unnamed protein product [Cyberlindnera jadinii]